MLEVGHPRRSCLTLICSLLLELVPDVWHFVFSFYLFIYLLHALSQPAKIALLTENHLSRNFHETDTAS